MRLTNRFSAISSATIVSVLLSGACAKAGENATSDSVGSPSAGLTRDTAAGATGMGDMRRMEGMKGTEGMMGDMQTQMKSMMDADGEQMKTMLPAHRTMMANMLSQMNGEMRQMNMAADAGWTATADSLRQDLARMPDMSATELKAMMPAHSARMTRLGEMHRQMMKSMPKP